ncbi:MAG: DUF3570 domain-containing protein [Verrucomicrobiota bacterium]
MKFAPSTSLRAVAFSTLLVWLTPRIARAESSAAYKHEDYREAGGRIVVKTDGAYLEQDFGTASHIKVEGILDAIAGATPNGQPAPAGSDQVPLAKLTERRKAWSAGFSHQFTASKLTLGVANSRESDYVSTGLSLNSQTDFNQKNTTLLIGIAGTDDDVKVFYQADRAKKRTHDLIVGVTQLLDPNTAVTLNLTWGRQRGYLSDPYKLVQKNTEIITGVFLPLTFAENRPDERDKWIALANINRALPPLGATIDLSYRFYHDTFGTDAHTLDFAWFQNVGERVILRPSLRFYDQTAASFYRYRFDGTNITPVQGPPRPDGPFYSSDYRLSEMRTTTYGLKVIWKITDALHIDASYERYDMRGQDEITPQSAYARADIWAAGVKFAW